MYGVKSHSKVAGTYRINNVVSWTRQRIYLGGKRKPATDNELQIQRLEIKNLQSAEIKEIFIPKCLLSTLSLIKVGTGKVPIFMKIYGFSLSEENEWEITL